MCYGRLFAALILIFFADLAAAQQFNLAPPPPSTPSVSLQSSNAILISWSAVSASHYELSANINGSWQPSIRVDSYTYNYAASPGNSYLFRVRACKGVYDNYPPTQPPLLGLLSTTTATQTEFCSTWTSNSALVSLSPIPGVPSSPNVSSVGTQVTLTWTAVANASYYIVTAADVSGQITEYRASANNSIITLKLGGSYILRVRACSTSGCSQSSGATTVTIVPSVVSNVNISVSGYTMTFSWGAVNGAYRYILQQYQNGAWGSEIDVGGATSKQFTGSDGGYYEFRVKACNSGGCSAFSAEKTAGFIPRAPTTPQVSLSGLTVTVSWPAVSGNLSYRVQQYASGNWQTEIDVGTVASKAFSGVAGSAYRYRVRSCNATGCSAFSPEVSTSLVPSIIGAAPSVSSSGTQMTVRWTLSSGAKNYKVQQYSSGAWQPESDVGLAISYVFNGTAGSTYQYRVRACNDGGCSAYSAASSYTLIPAIPVVPNVTTSGTAITVKWAAVAGASGYRIQQYAYGVWQTEVDIGSTLTKTFIGVAGETYQFRVRACNSAGCSAYSISAASTLVPSVPKIPTVASNGTTINVSWSDVMGATNYRIQQYVRGVWQIEINVGATLTRSFTGEAGNTYQYRLRACNNAGCSPFSNISTVTLTPEVPAIPSVQVSGLNMSVTWPAVEGATSYKVQQYLGSAWQSESDIGTLLSKSYVGVLGQNYQYRVRACNTSGCSPYSTASASIEITNRVTTYLHTDVLGSVIAETDESGTVKKTTDYKPFGESKNN